ncbi:putative E3 ubiquitin-protein ligase UBR7 [Pitangus sulphuratus]|nr:putative E3 ubiquitin-protein ligase UBR7 [Pitangus sulphuratus]
MNVPGNHDGCPQKLRVTVGSGNGECRAWRMMNFRQRMGWIGVGLYLLASAAAFYYVFEINETYNKLALEHIQQHPKEPQEGTTWTHSLKEKGKVNAGNKYNDNFYGLYCTCKRPYPDPEDEIPDEMIQCIVCEDWFHGRHLGAVPPESGDFHEMVCQACMKHCHFLWAYASQLAVPPLTKVNSLEDEGIVLKVEESEEQKKEIKKESGVELQDTKEEKQTEQFNEPSTSSGSACPEVVTKSEEPVCKLKELQSKPFLKKDTATFWPSNWRSKLCTCEDCLKMYSDLEVQFLTDECDTVLAYENKGTSDQETERRDPLMDTLNSMNRVQQVELICEYNDLKTELTDYLRRFADEGTAWGCDPFPGEPVPVPNHPHIQPKPPLTQLQAIPSSPVTGHNSEEISACPSSSLCEEAVDCHNVSPQSPPG